MRSASRLAAVVGPVEGGRADAGSVGGRRAGAGSARTGVLRARRASVIGNPDPRSATDVLAVAAALRAGASPVDAWRRCWGVVAPDGVPDLADVRRRCAAERHARAVVAGARLAARTGAPLAGVLERVGAAVADDESVEVQRRAALAGPRATARVLAWLPLVGVALGWALGADPVAVLLGGPLGVVLLGAAALLSWVGRRWSARLVRAAQAAGDGDRAPGEVDVAVILDLLEAACAAGSSVPGALEAVGAAAHGARGRALTTAARHLAEGATWRDAWAGSDAALGPVALALRPAWEDGVAPTGGLRATAAHLRRERQGAALAAAGRLGVRLVLPLAACHLPAFVLVGLVPVLVSVGGAALG